MNAKRILPWENWDEGHWEAETKVEDYHVQHHDYRDDTAGYEAYSGNDWPRELGVFDTPGQAIDACEADYIARCTEFLSLYDAKMHVVVSRDSLAVLLDYWFGDCPNDKFVNACRGAAELRAALEVK